MSKASPGKREKARLNELLEQVGDRLFRKRRAGRASYRMSVNDLRWAVALQRADRAGDCTRLIELLRSRRPMPREIEMSRLARDLLAKLLDERWSGHPLARHGRMKPLFEPKAEDDFRAAATLVRRLQYGEKLLGDIEAFDTPQMSEDDAIREAVRQVRARQLRKKPAGKAPKRRGGKPWHPGITAETLANYMAHEINFGERPKKRRKKRHQRPRLQKPVL